MVATERSSSVRTEGFTKDRLLAINGCQTAEFSQISDLMACAENNAQVDANIEVGFKGVIRKFQLEKSADTVPISYNYL